MELSPSKRCISDFACVFLARAPTIVPMLAEQLVGEARARRERGMESRERIVIAVSAFAFLLTASAVAYFIPSERTADPLLIAGLAIAYPIVSRVRFEFADSYVSPEQIVFVAMLALVPLPLIPLLVAAGGVLSTLPELVRRTWHQERWLTPMTESWFAIGPVLVLAALAPGEPTFADAGIYCLAFGAQLVGDVGWTLTRNTLLDHRRPMQQLRASVGTGRVDAILAPFAFVIAVAAVDQPLALLAAAPLVWLLEIFSRDRTARYTATLELNRAYRGTVMLLSDVIEFDDAYTGTHSRSVVDLVRAVAEEMDVDPNGRQELEFAALLHDVGKIAIPKEILNKPAALTDAEFELMKTHTIEGQFMLDRIGGSLGRVGEVVRSCHERWDGRGYPDGLRGEESPLPARIVFACDAYNAMTTDRPYRPAMSSTEALDELISNSGTQFDPAVVAALIEVVGQMKATIAPEAEIRALLSATRAQSARVAG